MSLGIGTFKVSRETDKIQTGRYLIGSAISGNHNLNVQLSKVLGREKKHANLKEPGDLQTPLRKSQTPQE